MDAPRRGVGGALGIHAASFGRSEALKEQFVRSVSASKMDGGEEWLCQWTRAPTVAPYATNFHVRDVPDMTWKSGHKVSTLTAQRVFNRGGLEELRSETMKARAALPPVEGVRPAGAPSGCTDRDIGRMAALNCGLKKI
mmetsp:Transcript_17032/g.20939  ORF Transcript_17032/g.20939 Transcript_17032/m.20939 type:complete len:139 (-) Transcript_17032:48-464(-)